MKNLFLHSVLMASLAGVGAVATAQAQTTTQQPDQTQQAAPQGGQYHHRHAPNPQRETKMLTKKLGLSADQAAQVEPILADRAQRMEALSSTQGDPASMKTQRRTIIRIPSRSWTRCLLRHSSRRWRRCTTATVGMGTVSSRLRPPRHPRSKARPRLRQATRLPAWWPLLSAVACI